MAWKTATVSSAFAMYDDIVASLKSEAFMGAGNAWVERYRIDFRGTFAPSNGSGINQMIVGLTAPGDADSCETINTVLRFLVGGNNTGYMQPGAFVNEIGAVPGGALHTYRGTWVSGTNYAVGDVVRDPNQSSGVESVCVVAHTAVAGNRPSVSNNLHWVSTSSVALFAFSGSDRSWMPEETHKCWNAEGGNSLTYWLVANRRRFMLLTKSGSGAGAARYHFCYVGGMNRFGPIDFNPFPVFLGVNGLLSTAFSDADDGTPLYNTSGNRLYVCSPLLNWLESDGSSASLFAFTAGAWDFLLPDPVTGEFALREYHIQAQSTNDRGLIGTLDGIYASSWKAGVISEDVITVDGVSHIIFEDVYRGQGSRYFAMRLA